MIRGSEIVAFATVDRNEDGLIKQPPVVMLQICGDGAFKKALFALKLSKDLEFLLVDTPVFAYEPVLKRLQEKVDLPLADDLLVQNHNDRTSQSPLIPESVVKQLEERNGNNVQHILKTAKAITLDPSQMEALLAGLMKPLSLIQGPPGVIQVLYTSSTKTDLFRHWQVFYWRVACQSIP